MPLQIVRAEDIPALTKIRLGIVARQGTGKTTFASTIPPSERVFFNSVDVENIRSVAHLKHFTINKLNRWNDLFDVYQLIRGALVEKKPRAPTVLVFDTWSRMQDLAIGKVTGYDPSNPEDPKFLDYINRIPRSVDGWKGWNQVGALMTEWMMNFNRLPVHIVYLMQELDRVDKTDEEIETGPRLTPEAAKGLKDSLEVFGRMYVEIGDTVWSPEQVVSPQTNGVSDKEAEAIVKNITKSERQQSKIIDPAAVETRKFFIGYHERYFAKGPTHLLGRVVVNPTWDNVVVPVLTQTPLPAVAAQNGALIV